MSEQRLCLWRKGVCLDQQIYESDRGDRTGHICQKIVSNDPKTKRWDRKTIDQAEMEENNRELVMKIWFGSFCKC